MKGSLPRMALMIVLIIAVSAVVTTISFSIFFAMSNNNDDNSANQAQTSQGTANPNYGYDPVLLEYEVGAVTTNLNDNKYVQCTVVLRYPEVKRKTMFGLMEEDDPTILEALDKNANQIKAAIHAKFNNENSSSLRGDKVEEVKKSMVDEINKILDLRVGVYDILFVEIRVS